jgi:hypothetical protein
MDMQLNRKVFAAAIMALILSPFTTAFAQSKLFDIKPDWLLQAANSESYLVLYRNSSNPLIAIAVDNGGQMKQTENGGSTWEDIEGPFPGVVPSSLVDIQQNPNIIAAQAPGYPVCISADNGKSWQTPESNAAITASAIVRDGYIFGTEAGNIFTDNGSRAVHPRDGYLYSLVVDPASNAIYAGYFEYRSDEQGALVLESLDGGATWHSIDGEGESQLPDGPIESLTIHGGRLFAATSLGVYSMVLGSSEWESEELSLDGREKSLVVVHNSNAQDDLYAFVYENGIASLYKRGDGTASNRIIEESSMSQYCSIPVLASNCPHIFDAEGGSCSADLTFKRSDKGKKCAWHINILPKNKPRFFSVSRSSGKGPAHITVKVSKWNSNDGGNHNSMRYGPAQFVPKGATTNTQTQSIMIRQQN